jgi:hypothetical protein
VHAPNLVFAYFAPEILLPVTSVVATVIGIVMMFGRNSFRLIARLCRRALLRPEPVKMAMKKPHIRPRNGRYSNGRYSELARR